MADHSPSSGGAGAPPAGPTGPAPLSAGLSRAAAPVRFGAFEVFIRGQGDDAEIGLRDHSTPEKHTVFYARNSHEDRFLAVILAMGDQVASSRAAAVERARKFLRESSWSPTSARPTAEFYVDFALSERAETRREALEEAASMCESGSQIGVTEGGKIALIAMAACLRQLALSTPSPLPRDESGGEQKQPGATKVTAPAGVGESASRESAADQADASPAVSPRPQAAEAETRRQGHSALRWDKENQRMETFDPNPQAPIKDDLDEPAQIAKEISGRAAMMASMLRSATMERDQALAQVRAINQKRDASAPPSSESAPDVFEQTAIDFYEMNGWPPVLRGRLAVLLRKRFGSMVSAMEMIAKHPCGATKQPAGYHCGECAWCIAKEEVAQLRARAEAGGG